MLVQFALLVLLMAFGGYILEHPTHPAEKSQVIVILGGASVRFRLITGARLFTAGYAPHVLVTGCMPEGGFGLSEITEWRLKWLHALGIPQNSILTDSAARNSWEEALAVKRLLTEKGWKRALVVSDPPHMRRLQWIYRRVFEDSNREYRLVSSNPEWWSASAWWRNSISASFVIMEHIKMFYYLIRHQKDRDALHRQYGTMARSSSGPPAAQTQSAGGYIEYGFGSRRMVENDS